MDEARFNAACAAWVSIAREIARKRSIRPTISDGDLLACVGRERPDLMRVLLSDESTLDARRQQIEEQAYPIVDPSNVEADGHMDAVSKKRAAALAKALKPIEAEIFLMQSKDPKLSYAAAFQAVAREHPDLVRTYDKIAKYFAGDPSGYGDAEALAQAQAEIYEQIRLKRLNDPNLSYGLAFARVMKENPELAAQYKAASKDDPSDAEATGWGELVPLSADQARHAMEKEVYALMASDRGKGVCFADAFEVVAREKPHLLDSYNAAARRARRPEVF